MLVAILSSLFKGNKLQGAETPSQNDERTALQDKTDQGGPRALADQPGAMIVEHKSWVDREHKQSPALALARSVEVESRPVEIPEIVKELLERVNATFSDERQAELWQHWERRELADRPDYRRERGYSELTKLLSSGAAFLEALAIARAGLRNPDPFYRGYPLKMPKLVVIFV